MLDYDRGHTGLFGDEGVTAMAELWSRHYWWGRDILGLTYYPAYIWHFTRTHLYIRGWYALIELSVHFGKWEHCLFIHCVDQRVKYVRWPSFLCDKKDW